MTLEGWRELVEHCATNEKLREGVAQYLWEVDEARQALRDKGYGVTGTPIIHQVAEVPTL